MPAAQMMRGLGASQLCGFRQGTHVWLPVPRKLVIAKATATKPDTKKEDAIAIKTIDGLDTDFCDDFICEGSPQVENSIRLLARDLQRVKLSPSLFQKDATYTDGFRKFQGADKFSQRSWYKDNMQRPMVTISKLRMVDKCTAQVAWRVAGAAAGSRVDIGVTTTITMNQLTGRISDYKESWDLSRVSPPTSLMLTVGRWVWSLQQTGKNVSNPFDSMTSMDDDNPISPNPTDPTRFFFNNQQESQWNDYVSYATLAALLYLAFRAYAELDKLQ